MRNYLFRGKRKNNIPEKDGTWVYGLLSCLVDDTYSIGKYQSDLNLVDPKTIGQFTGLLDKNGKKIFDDDIIKFRGKIYLVSWHDKFACFAIFIPNDLDSGLKIYDAKECEIIGNIHDNPELLEGIK